MPYDYIQIIKNLIFPKDNVSKDIGTLPSFGYKPIPGSDSRVWVATEYQNELIHELIERVKINKEFDYSKELVETFGNKLRYNFDISAKILLVSVPYDPKRYIEDGFALSELLVKGLSQKLDLPYGRILTKPKSTKKQSYLNREERLVNLDGKIKEIEGVVNVANFNQIWIIDDITTTGATLLECQKMVLANWPFVEVKLFALASN